MAINRKEIERLNRTVKDVESSTDSIGEQWSGIVDFSKQFVDTLQKSKRLQEDAKDLAAKQAALLNAGIDILPFCLSQFITGSISKLANKLFSSNGSTSSKL